MPPKSRQTTLQPLSDINLTPLMDITFILLIAFIITVPLMEQGIHVNLPQAQGDPLEPRETRTISLTQAGELFLDDAPVTHAELTTRMEALGRTSPQTTVLVRADEDLAYRAVVRVVKILHAAKVSRLALVTRQEE
jgi:biopolymer transport protein ExbD